MQSKEPKEIRKEKKCRQKKIKLILLYSIKDWFRSQPFINPEVQQFNTELAKKCAKKNIKVFKTALPYYNPKNKVFEKFWQYEKGEWKKNKQELRPQIIINRTENLDGKKEKLFKILLKNSTLLNNFKFKEVIRSKVTQCILFKKHMPKTFFIESKRDLIKKIKLIKTKNKVLKPISGRGGKGIIIGSKNKILKQNPTYPCLLQEFVEVRDNKQISDLRIVIAHNKPIYSIKRIAQDKSFFTNITHGATVQGLDLKNINPKVKNILKQVIKTLKIFPNSIYSVDFLFDKKNNPKLIEINSNPGIALAQATKNKKIINAHINALIKLVEQA